MYQLLVAGGTTWIVSTQWVPTKAKYCLRIYKKHCLVTFHLLQRLLACRYPENICFNMIWHKIMIYYVIIWWSWSSISSCGGAPKQISTPAEIGKGRRTEKMSSSSSSRYQKPWKKHHNQSKLGKYHDKQTTHVLVIITTVSSTPIERRICQGCHLEAFSKLWRWLVSLRPQLHRWS